MTSSRALNTSRLLMGNYRSCAIFGNVRNTKMIDYN